MQTRTMPTSLYSLTKEENAVQTDMERVPIPEVTKHVRENRILRRGQKHFYHFQYHVSLVVVRK